ncbi:MAG: O-antigen ligase family protein [Erythrobacter sp.]|uniref:O-antigen ligase family protein n=1 Tax=Erythrobacter sp. TaxID=1042 RepID=UPI003C775AD9
MSELENRGGAPGPQFLVGQSRTVDGMAGLAHARNAPFDPIGASPATGRFLRILLMLAVFFCGYAELRVGGINLTLSDILLSIAMVVLLYRGMIERQPFGKLTPFWFLGLGLMLLGLLIGSVVNGSVDRWVIVGAQYLFAFLLVPMVIMGQPAALTRMFPALFVLGVTISQLIGVSASLLFEPQDIIAVMGTDFVTGNGRVGALSGGPNANGALIAFALPMLLYSVQNRTMPLWIGIVCGVILFWGSLATGSFTGFAASMIALGIFLAVSGIWLFIRAAILGAIVLGLFLASDLPVPTVFEERVAGALTTGDLNQAGTYTGRAELIDEAWEMADDNVLVGLGVDQFRQKSSYGAPVHELHLLVWNEGGIVGFAGLVILLLTMVASGVAALSRMRSEGAMILAVVAVFNVYTVSIPHMYARTWVLPVLLAMGTFFAIRQTMQADDRNPRW